MPPSAGRLRRNGGNPDLLIEGEQEERGGLSGDSGVQLRHMVWKPMLRTRCARLLPRTPESEKLMRRSITASSGTIMARRNENFGKTSGKNLNRWKPIGRYRNPPLDQAAIARNFLFQPLGSLLAEGPGSGWGARGGRGCSGPSLVRIARFGRMSQRFSSEARRSRGPIAPNAGRIRSKCRGRGLAVASRCSSKRGPYCWRARWPSARRPKPSASRTLDCGPCRDRLEQARSCRGG